MNDLKVNDTFKIRVSRNNSARSHYDYETTDDDLLEISGPEYIAPEPRNGLVMLGASGSDEYTITVKEAGQGMIEFVNYYINEP